MVCAFVSYSSPGGVGGEWNGQLKTHLTSEEPKVTEPSQAVNYRCESRWWVSERYTFYASAVPDLSDAEPLSDLYT